MRSGRMLGVPATGSPRSCTPWTSSASPESGAAVRRREARAGRPAAPQAEPWILDSAFPSWRTAPLVTLLDGHRPHARVPGRDQPGSGNPSGRHPVRPVRRPQLGLRPPQPGRRLRGPRRTEPALNDRGRPAGVRGPRPVSAGSDYATATRRQGLEVSAAAPDPVLGLSQTQLARVPAHSVGAVGIPQVGVVEHVPTAAMAATAVRAVRPDPASTTARDPDNGAHQVGHLATPSLTVELVRLIGWRSTSTERDALCPGLQEASRGGRPSYTRLRPLPSPGLHHYWGRHLRTSECPRTWPDGAGAPSLPL